MSVLQGRTEISSIAGVGPSTSKGSGRRSWGADDMRRSALCVLVVLLLCFATLPKPVLAQSHDVEDVTLERADYPAVKASTPPVRVYAGNWSFEIAIRNYDGAEETIDIRVFVDNVLKDSGKVETYYYDIFANCNFYYDPIFYYGNINFSELGVHEVLVQIWRTGETQPRETYNFNVTVVKPEVSGLQASSRVVRALGDNSLVVSLTNGGNVSFRQAVLTVVDTGGLTVTPSEVELGDVEPDENASAIFTVSSPADVYLGTTQVRFSLSFIDYAGVPHTEDVYGHIDVYRLTPTLVLTVPSTAENGSTVEITAALKDPGGNPIPNENIIFTSGDVFIRASKTGGDGVARVSYVVTETGIFDIGAAFAGSASYDASSDSRELEVTPAAPSLDWSVILVILLVVLFVILGVVWAVRRRKAQPVRRTRRGEQENIGEDRHDG